MNDLWFNVQTLNRNKIIGDLATLTFYERCKNLSMLRIPMKVPFEIEIDRTSPFAWKWSNNTKEIFVECLKNLASMHYIQTIDVTYQLAVRARKIWELCNAIIATSILNNRSNIHYTSIKILGCALGVPNSVYR